MSAQRWLPAAQSIAEAIPAILTEQGLEPRINRYVLTESEHGEAWLFVIMDDSILESLEAYSAPDVLTHLKTILHGHPVVFSNSFGLRYAVLLSSTNPD